MQNLIARTNRRAEIERLTRTRRVTLDKSRGLIEKASATIHLTETGFVLLTVRRYRAGSLAVIQLEGESEERTYHTVAESHEFLVEAFNSRFPEHTCTTAVQIRC